jgi:tetratricopeptide (TPR) repeat protein
MENPVMLPKRKYVSALLLTTGLTLPLAGCLDDTAVSDGDKSVSAAGAVCRGGAVSMPLFDDLGTHAHKITTSSPEAQAYFNQGYRYLFNFNHAGAISSFQEALKRDPKCAMCWWGIAFAHGPNINMPMMPDAMTPAWQALTMAQSLSANASEAERDYIAALATRYAEKPPQDRSSLDKAFAAAVHDLAKKYPNDLDAQVLYAESLMDTSPWNYWQTDKKTPNAGLEDLAPTLEAVLAKAPNHPGAIHLYIHAVEVPFPKKAEKAADRLTTLMPGAGHLVHMPTHIYNRIGRYDDAVEWNKKAAKADEKYFARTGDRAGMYAAMYYVHNLHFVWTAAMTEGRSATALEFGQAVVDRVQPQMAREVPGIEVFVPTLTYAQLRFGKWDDVLASPAPDAELHLATAMYHYARARAFAAKGDVKQAKAEQAQIVKSFGAEDDTRFSNFGVPGRLMVAIADNVAQADIALAQRQTKTAIAKLQAAVKAQDQLPYMEPPYWDFPVRQYLGAALLNAGRAKEAEKAYREDLHDWMRNGWSLYGLSEALKRQGKRREASEARQAYLEAWSRADVDLKQSRF